MTILDLEEQRELRRRAEWDKWEAAQDRQLAEIHRILEKLTPIVDQLLAEKKVHARHPRCEASGCWSTITTLHPVQGRTSDDAPALIALCARHLGAVRSGRFRVKAEEADTLLWQLFDRPGAPPSLQIKLPRRRVSTRKRGARPQASSLTAARDRSQGFIGPV